MIAKLITHAPTRGAALNALRTALEGARVAGSTTNLAFLAALTRDADFKAGRVDTGLIARRGAALTATPSPSAEARALAALLGLRLHRASPHQGFTLWAPLKQSIRLTHDGEECVTSVEPLGSGQARVDGTDISFAVLGTDAVVNGRHLGATCRPDRITIFEGAVPHVFGIVDPLAVAGEKGVATNHIAAPMPGLVKAVLTQEGEEVTAGAPLLILEAMKMEHTLRAPRGGIIDTLATAEGAQVSDGDILLTLQDDVDG
jgi:3-methylcrotonyl-CoA carboxylase alpha subunit